MRVSRKLAMILALAGVAASSTACLSFRLGTDNETPLFVMDGPGSAYATMSQIGPYDGTAIKGQFFRGGKETGQLASLGIWPLGEFDLGLVGGRVKLFTLEVGAGTLCYQPQPLAGDVAPGAGVGMRNREAKAKSSKDAGSVQNPR